MGIGAAFATGLIQWFDPKHIQDTKNDNQTNKKLTMFRPYSLNIP